MSELYFKGKLFQAFLASVPNFIGVVNVALDQIIEVSQAGLVMFGVNNIEEFKQKYPVGISSEDFSPERYQNAYAKILEKGEITEHIECKHYDGHTFWVLLNLFAIEVENSPYLIVRITDLEHVKKHAGEINYSKEQLELMVSERTTSLVETLKDLKKSQTELTELLEKEYTLNERKTKFITAASHEFRTPLSVMKTSLSLLKKYNQSDNKLKQQQYIHSIEQQIVYLTEILEESIRINLVENHENIDLVQNHLDFHEIAKIVKEAKKVDII